MNALKELYDILEDLGLNCDIIRCAYISFHGNCLDPDDYRDDEYREYKYIDDNTDESLENFLKFLDYDNGFGGQELFGMIWFLDDSWLERHEYDGSEWWEYKKFKIPEYLFN